MFIIYLLPGMWLLTFTKTVRRSQLSAAMPTKHFSYFRVTCTPQPCVLVCAAVGHSSLPQDSTFIHFIDYRLLLGPGALEWQLMRSKSQQKLNGLLTW